MMTTAMSAMAAAAAAATMLERIEEAVITFTPILLFLVALR